MPPTPILFCSHVVELGGAEVVLVDLLSAIDRERFVPHLACPGQGPLAARSEALGVPVHPVPLPRGSAWRKAVGLPAAALALRRVAAATGCRLLVATSMIAGYAAVMAKHRGLPCVWHVHVVTASRIARFALRSATGVIAPSRAGLAAIAPDLLASPRAAVVPNGVDGRFFTSAGGPWRRHLGLAEGEPLLGIVGRLDPQKGHEVLVDAVARLDPARRPHVVVAGGELFADNQARVGGFGARLQQRIAAAGLVDRFHLLGPVDDAAALFAGLDVVVVPSIAPESAPRAIAEAQATGRAVVASAIGGTPEMIAHGTSGWLVPPGDAAALAGAISQLLADPALRDRLAAGGRAFAAANYRMDTFARRIEDAFTRALTAG